MSFDVFIFLYFLLANHSQPPGVYSSNVCSPGRGSLDHDEYEGHDQTFVAPGDTSNPYSDPDQTGFAFEDLSYMRSHISVGDPQPPPPVEIHPAPRALTGPFVNRRQREKIDQQSFTVHEDFSCPSGDADDQAASD